MLSNERNRMDERLRFAARILEGEKMVVACRELGISRMTGYMIYNEAAAVRLKLERLVIPWGASC